MAQNQDYLNAEINLGSTFKDILPALQGLWTDTVKNGWNLIKLGSKIGFAIQTVESGKAYLLPVKMKSELTGILYIGNDTIKGNLIKVGDEAITAPLTGLAIIILK